MLSFCLFISITGKKNHNNIIRANMLLKSLSKFSKETSNIYIVAPEKSVDFISLNLKRYSNLIYNFIKDEDILPHIYKYRTTNSWYIQQVLKLAVHKFIETEFYMIFDSDIICCREFSTSSFLKDNKSFVSYTKSKNCYDWAKGSSIILQVEAPSPDTLIMNITPNIFATDIAKKLLKYIEDMYKSPADIFLLDHTEVHWSEYTLYYLFARHSGIFNKMHVDFLDRNKAYPQNYILSDYSLWRKSSYHDLDSISIDKIKEEKSYFIVVQSTTSFTMSDIGKKFSYFMT